MKNLRFLTIAAALCLACAFLPRPWAQEAAPQKPPYEKREVHDPNGTGLFYMGREMAQVMGHQAADWLDRPEREQEEQPEKMLNALHLTSGMNVADIGAGSGYLTFRMSKRVAPTGKVYAVEIQPEMLDIIHKRMLERGIKNVVEVLGDVADPKLPPSSQDLIIMVDVYHEFDHPWEMTRSMIKSLKPGGRLVLVEYRLEDPKVPIKLVHKMSVAQVKKEMSIWPIKFVESIETLPWQHIIVFKK